MPSVVVFFVFPSQNGMDAKATTALMLVLIELVLISAVRFKDVDRQANLHRKYGVQMPVIRLLL
jgi:hypothetical protein